VARWAKLHDKVSESYDFAEAHRRDPNAALLFLLALPHADVYGILPGHPRLLHKVCALLDLTDDQLDAAFRVLHEIGLVICYLDSKQRPLVCIVNYGTHQDVRWDRVAPPTHELPPGWTPPNDLKEACKKYPECEVAAWLRQACGSGPGVVPEDSRLDTDTEEDTEAETDPTGGTPPAAGVASGKPMNLKLMGSPDPPADLVAAREKAKPEGVQFAVALWALFRQEGTPPKTVFAATGKFCKRHGERWRVFVDTITDTDLHGAEAETKLVGLVIDAEPENKRFTWDPEKQGVAPRATGQRFYTDSAGTRVYERDWDPDDAADLSRDIAAHVAAGNWDAKRGATKTPVAGWVCTDGHWYDKVLGEPVKGRKVL